MCRIRLLILSFSLLCLLGCVYSFVLDGGGTLGQISIAPSANETSLREAGIILDKEIETALSSMGLLSTKEGLPQLKCIIMSATAREITSPSLSADDRYRLTVHVSALLKDVDGKTLWRSNFSDKGTYNEGGQEEDALEESLKALAQQIARQLASLKI